MTREEKTGERSLEFSKWIRKYLPDSSKGFCVTNQDWIFWNYKTRELMLIEEKTKDADLATWFKRLIKDVLHPALEEYCSKNDIKYYGYHIVQFENTAPNDGVIKFDYREVTELELRNILSFEEECG